MKKDRMLCESLKERIMSSEQATALIEPGMTIAFSGFSSGAPKAIPREMVKLGKAKDLTLICGAALDPVSFGPLADNGMIKRYSAFQFVPNLRKAINTGNIAYTDVHLGLLSQMLRNGVFSKIDCSVIECAKINQDGGIVPSVSVGISNTLFECSEKVILEINTTVPDGIEGFHDICGRGAKVIETVMERVGEPVFRCNPDKIAAIVISDIPEQDWIFRDVNEVYEGIAANVVDCLSKEIKSGRIEKEFTMQVGVGGVANTVLACLRKGGFKNLKMYTEVFADAALDFVEDGLFTAVSTTCFDLSRKYIKKVFDDIEYYKKRIVLRPLEYTNGAPNILGMSLVAMNTAVEADIYGNVNSTHALGTNMIYGVGGSNDFARNAKLTVFLTPSTAKNGSISSIVPMVTHVDSSEHDTDIIVTEHGYADLRGLSPKERAVKIIQNCAHPDYRLQLWDYYNCALELCGPTQTPHNLSEAYAMHVRYKKTGTMKTDKQ